MSIKICLSTFENLMIQDKRSKFTRSTLIKYCTCVYIYTDKLLCLVEHIIKRLNNKLYQVWLFKHKTLIGNL